MTFHCCLSVVLWPEEGDFPENMHRVVYVIINKRSFESFTHQNSVKPLALKQQQQQNQQ